MAKPTKKKKSKQLSKWLMAFFAGLAAPVCLVLAWHTAHGQEAVNRGVCLLNQTVSGLESLASGKTESPAAEPGRDDPVRKRPATGASPPPMTANLSTIPDKQPAQPSAPGKNAAASQAAPAMTPTEELAHMRKLFQLQVQQKTQDRLDRYKQLWNNSAKLQKIVDERRQRLARLDKTYRDFVGAEIRQQMAKAGLSFNTSQYFVFADRNPVSQVILVGLYDAGNDSIEFLGADLISSGDLEKGGDYFVTPTGVFENRVENFSYRAMGTPNQEGWRGLGAKDMRVWDFGDQKSLKKYKGGNTMSQMRLLMHATDPARGEQRLGRTDSKGCVRISHSLNRFLDTYAILDSHYEAWAKTRPDSWLLRKDRQPVLYPGQYLIIGDSSSLLRTAAKP